MLVAILAQVLVFDLVVVFSVLMEPSSSLPSELIQQIRALTRNQLFELQIELTHEINYRWDIERAVGTFRQWGPREPDHPPPGRRGLSEGDSRSRSS